jgi:ABC-type lipoprotein export system ATPase subunit
MTAEAVRARGLISIHGAGIARVGPGVPALRGLDVTVAAGELAAIVGPSGSGKTTFLRLVAGADRPAAGELSVFGVELESAAAGVVRDHRTSTVGVVEQHYRRALSPYVPVREIVELPLAVRGVAGRERRARVAELLEGLGLAGREEARTYELSGGEQQRVAIAAALAPRPRLLLADEPTGELDAETAATLLLLLREAVRRDGATCVIVTHDEAVEAIADRVVVLQDGRAIAERVGPPGEDERRLVDSIGWHAPEGSTRRTAPASAVSSVGTAPARATSPGSRAGATAAAVVLEGVSRTFGAGRGAVSAIRGLDGRIPLGGFHVICGPSGSGKSTLLRLVAGLDLHDAGRIEVLGDRPAALEPEARAAFRARRIGIAEQARGLVGFLDLRENVELALAIRNGSGDDDADDRSRRERAQAALDRLGIGHLSGRRPWQISAGERTRAAIARAVVADPELLILDEPTATLDRANARVVADLLVELGRSLTVIAATHDPALIDASESRLVLG